MSSLIVEMVRIGELTKHPNADTLWLTQVKGWNCIVKEGQFSPGDLAIYIPIDSVLPDSLVEKHQLEYLKNGARVRTVKLRGVISQGLLLTPPEGSRYREGQNVAEELGIKKWEPPAPSYQGTPNLGKATKNRPNPNFTRYCDPENIKHYPDIFQPGDLVSITEKIHGTCFRAGWVKRYWPKTWWKQLIRVLFGRWLGEWEFAVGSRNVHLVGDKPQYYDGNVYHQIAKRYDLQNKLPRGWTIYGEIYGDKIQDLTYGKTNGEIDVVFFDMKDWEGKYTDWWVFCSFCKEMDLPIVPIDHEGPFTQQVLEEYTTGQSALAPGQIREGCVIKSLTETNNPYIGRKILKSISADYLLRSGGTEFH